MTRPASLPRRAVLGGIASALLAPAPAFAQSPTTSLNPALAQPLLDVAYRYGLLTQPVVASTLFWKG